MGRRAEGPAGGAAVTPAAILLVPTGAHREALIGDGPCGSRAPVAWLRSRIVSDAVASWWEPGPPGRDPDVGFARYALVLAWDGRPVADGVSRLRSFLASVRRLTWTEYVPGLDGMAELLRTIRHRPDWFLGDSDCGRLVLLDADGREIA